MKKLLTTLLMLLTISISINADTWTVAGSSAALNGTKDWSPESPENDMTEIDGIYQLTVTGCTLEAGTTYQYKVAKDHGWAEAYPGQDKTFTVPETAVYTVVYSFNPSTKEVSEATTKTGEAGVIEHIYSIAGNCTDLFNAAWSESEKSTEMVLTDGIYTWTKNDIELDAQTIEFKVVVDHSWGTAYPASNYELVIPKKAHYNITITFDESKKEVSASAESIKYDFTVTFVNTDDWENVYAYVWSGTGGDVSAPVAWPGSSMTNTGTQLDGHDIYTHTINTEYAPEYIIFNNGEENENLLQTMDQAFVPNKQYDANPITVKARVGASGYATFSSEYALDFSKATTIKAYRAEVSEGTVMLYRVNAKVPANTGLLLAGEPNAEEDIEATKEVPPIGTNLLVATTDATEVDASTEGSYNYFLSTKNSQTGFYKVVNNITSAAGKAYLHTTSALNSEQDSRAAWIFDDEQIPTGISEVKKVNSSNCFYNLNGQRVTNPRNGLFILQNGKKLIIR